MTEPANTPVFEPDPRQPSRKHGRQSGLDRPVCARSRRNDHDCFVVARRDFLALGILCKENRPTRQLGLRNAGFRVVRVCKTNPPPISRISAAMNGGSCRVTAGSTRNMMSSRIPIELSMKILAERGIPEPVGPPNTVKQEEPAR